MPRPRSITPSPSALRMRRMMDRRRSEGRRIVQLTPTTETLKTLEQLATLTGGTSKSEAEMVLRRAVGSALAEARNLARHIGPIYRSAKEYLPYASFLEAPNASFRVGSRVLRASDWHPIAQALGSYHAKTRTWGWSRERADAFLRRAAA